jgi:hypothetical protein
MIVYFGMSLYPLSCCLLINNLGFEQPAVHCDSFARADPVQRHLPGIERLYHCTEHRPTCFPPFQTPFHTRYHRAPFVRSLCTIWLTASLQVRAHSEAALSDLDVPPPVLCPAYELLAKRRRRRGRKISCVGRVLLVPTASPSLSISYFARSTTRILIFPRSSKNIVGQEQQYSRSMCFTK